MAHSSVCDLRIVLLGKNVSENSRVRNLILGIDVCESDAPKTSHQHCFRISGTVKERHITVINTLHLLNLNISDRQITQTVGECVNLSDPGPHVFIIILQYKDFTEEDMTRVKHVLKHFSEEAIERTIVLTTDEETDDSQMSPVIKPTATHQLIKECGGRHIEFEKENPEWQSDIFKRVDKILKENHEEYLICEIYEDVKGTSVDEEQSRFDGSVKSEEENKKRPFHRDYQSNQSNRSQAIDRREQIPERICPDNSANSYRKQKLNIVLCGSKKTLTASVSKLLRGKKIKQSHERESNEVCVKKEEKIHGHQINLVVLPALNQLSEEEIMHQTLRSVSVSDPGVHVFLIIVPVGKLTNDDKAEIEKIQMIFYSKEHFIVIFISDFTVDKPKSIKENHRLISLCGGRYDVIGLKEPENSKQIPDLLKYIENMKTEPYSIQTYIKAQVNRARCETEQKYKEELKRMKNEIQELQEKLQSEGAECEVDDPECLRIVLIGRTGNGKSATGNTILGREEFESELSTDSVTTVCMKRVGEVDGKSVAVVDTPGLFDTTMSSEHAVDEIVKCVSLSSPGPHVFVIVLSLGRFIQVERDTINLIKKIFGPKSAQFSIILFTGGDNLKNKSIDKYISDSKSAELKKLLRDCGDRFLVFNNTETQDKTQVIQLINMIEEVKNTNEGRYFTNSMFEEAEMSIKKRMEEIMKEREKEILTQKEELQAKYEMEREMMKKRLEEEKQRADEERIKMENQLREKEEKLRKEFEEKEKTEQKKREIENQKRSEEEKQQRDEYHKKIEEMKKEIESQRSQYEKQQKEREEEDRKREEKYRQDQQQMKNEQESIIAELQMKQEEEIKKRESEEKRRNEVEEKERQEWERKIKEAEKERKEIQEEIKQQQREWEDTKNQQTEKREEEDRKRKENHEKQLKEKQEELENIKMTFEREREEEKQKTDEERQKQEREREEKEREYEEKKTEMKRRNEQLEQERKEELDRRKREDDERREEERKIWNNMIEVLKREQEEQIKRRETEENDRKKRGEIEKLEMKQKHEEEIKEMKKKHQDEARKQAEESAKLNKRKEELQQMLEEHQKGHEILEKLYKILQLQKEQGTKKCQQEVKQFYERLQVEKGDELNKLLQEVEKLLFDVEELNNKSGRCVIL